MRSAAIAGLVVALSGAVAWGGSEERLAADLNMGFFTGDYGGETTTEVQVMTPRLRWSLPRGTLRVSFPFLRISDPAGVAIVGGTPVASGRGAAAEAYVAGVGSARSVAGPGDVRLDGEVDLVRGGARRPWVTGSLRVKLPTAAEEDGLGTGEVDVEGALGLTQPVGRNDLMLDVRYARLGDPEAYELDDVASLGVGVSRRVGASERARVWAYVENRTHPTPDLPDRLDVAVGASRSLGRVRLSGSAFVGLSSSAEDLGVSLTLGGWIRGGRSRVQR